MATAPNTMDQSAASPIDRHAAPTTDTRSNSGKATASLILGIVAMLLVWLAIAAGIVGGVAIALALTAKSDIRRKGLGGVGQANAGLVLGIIAVVVGLAIGIVSAVITAS
jgi:hypothetical protein